MISNKVYHSLLTIKEGTKMAFYSFKYCEKDII